MYVSIWLIQLKQDRTRSLSLFFLNRFDNIEIKDIKYCLDDLEQYWFYLEDHCSNKLSSSMSRKTSPASSNEKDSLVFFVINLY